GREVHLIDVVIHHLLSHYQTIIGASPAREALAMRNGAVTLKRIPRETPGGVAAAARANARYDSLRTPPRHPSGRPGSAPRRPPPGCRAAPRLDLEAV